MADDEVVKVEMPEKQSKKVSVKVALAKILRENAKFCVFQHNLYYENDGIWLYIDKDDFSRIVYGVIGIGVTIAQINELYSLMSNYSADLTFNDFLISFGDNTIFNMNTLEFDNNYTRDDCFYRIKYKINKQALKTIKPIDFIYEIASKDMSKYNDIMQSYATLLMREKPVGVVWFTGEGANGKSTLMHFTHKIFDTYLCDLDIKSLEDGRDAPSLNGKLGNFNVESSDAFVQDSKIYKNIGAHEDFSVHKFQKQDTVRVTGNLAHIFCSNRIPTFADKTFAARRRTFLVPFREHFKDDPTFEKRNFTIKNIEVFLGQLVKYAIMIRDANGFTWSADAQSAKTLYDANANSAVTYFREKKAMGLIGALNFRCLYENYTNFCELSGSQQLSKPSFRNEMELNGFVWKSQRYGNTTRRVLLLNTVAADKNVEFSGSENGTAWDSEGVRESFGGDIGAVNNENARNVKLFNGVING